MFDNREIFTRELTARERRRYRKHRTLPIDSLQTSIALSVIVEQFQPRKFYRYGCELVDAFIELDDNNSSNGKVTEQRNSIFHLRGFISPSNFFLSLCILFFHSNLQCAFRLSHHQISLSLLGIYRTYRFSTQSFCRRDDTPSLPSSSSSSHIKQNLDVSNFLRYQNYCGQVDAQKCGKSSAPLIEGNLSLSQLNWSVFFSMMNLNSLLRGI